ncbi:putative xyloglucan:xyloglucosyl transferase [Helianthus anomalus]
MYSGLFHIKATFVKHEFIPICLINKIQCFKTLIFFLTHGPDKATHGGRVKTDWTKAPFKASYRKFNANANKLGPNSKSISSKNQNPCLEYTQGLDAATRNGIRCVQNKHMIYDYCNDYNQFRNGLPVECTQSRFL